MLGASTLFLIFTQLAVEAIQLGNERKNYVEYCTSVYNILDLLQLSTTVATIVMSLCNEGDEMDSAPCIRVIGACAILLGHKGFVWLTFFDVTGAAASGAPYGAEGSSPT